MRKKLFTAAALSALVLLAVTGCTNPTGSSQSSGTIIIDTPEERISSEMISGLGSGDQEGKSEQTLNPDGSEKGSDTVEPGSATDPVIDDQDVDSENPDFSGLWAEEIAGRGTITFTAKENNKYTVEVSWSASAFERAVWTMDAEYFKGSKLLEYMNCEYKIVTYTDEDTFTEESVYTNGTGYFWLEEDDRLGWKSDNSRQDGIDGSSFFKKN